MANKTIKDIVIENADALKAMTTHTELREWAISQGFNNRSAFPKFKLALNEIGLDYDVIKTGIKKQKSEELKAKINYELTLYSDAKASAGRYGITDKDGNVVWYGRFFENDNASEQSSAELEAAKKAVWFASKVKEALNEPAIKLTLYVDAEWLTYQDHSGQKGYALTTLASKYDIQLEVLWISGKKNPADKWTVASGFKKWQDNDLKSLADYIKDIDIPESDNELEIKEQDEDKTPSDVIENNTNNNMENKEIEVSTSEISNNEDINKYFQNIDLIIKKGKELRYLEGYIYSFAGDRNKKIRQNIMSYLLNKKVNLIDSGLNKLIKETYKWVKNNYNNANIEDNFMPIINKEIEVGTSEISNNSNDKPTPESKQRFSAIKEIDRKEITVMPELFQGRQNAYSEESVNKIVSEGFDKTNDPIIVWYDKDIEKYVVISGHSRWEASKRLFASGDVSLQTMPVKEYLGDKEESLNYAILESNRASTQEGLISDINAVRKMLVQGYNKTEMIKYIKPKSYLEKIINYTYLNPTGKFIEYLASDSKISFPYLERNAEWVGILRNMYGSKLTNSHENEIFDYIYLTDKKGLSLRKDELFNMIERKAGSLIFNPEEPLNLKNLGNVSPLVNPVIEIIKEHEKEISEMEKEISHKQDLIVRANNEGKTDLIDRFKSDISNLTTRILNEKTIVDRLNSQINTISKQSIYDLFSEIPAPIETKKILNLSEQDVANDEVIKCNAELDNYKNELNVSIPQINQIFTINGQKAILTNIDSYKLTFSIDDGKYNMKMVKLYTYSEIIEMFNNGNIKYDGYDNSTSEGKLNFENILTKKQLCLAKTENLNSLIHLKDKTEIILTSNLLNTNELNNQLSQKENEIKQIKEVVEEQNKPAEIDDKTLYLQAIEGLNILLELETNKKEIKSIKDAIEGLNIMVEL